MNADGFDIVKCYETLDVRPGATVSQVRKAYLDLAHVWDPAQHLNNPPLRLLAEQKRRELDAAYGALQGFLPELRSHRESRPRADIPERPADAIEETGDVAPAETRIYLFAFLAAMIIAVLLIIGVFLWRAAHAPSASFALAAAEEK